MSMNRRSFSDEFKAQVVRQHLVEKVPVSELAAEFEIQPSMIHLWIKQVLDGYSRYIVHWEIREHSKESDIELVLQRALEKCPTAKHRGISDNGPQFIANDFKSFIRLQGLTHVRTSPYYPQAMESSNAGMER